MDSTLPKMMNSVILHAKEKYSFGQLPTPKEEDLKEGQVIIKVDSCALNPSDIFLLNGLYRINVQYPITPGWEGSGIVVKAGKSDFAQSLIGKKVAFLKAAELLKYTIGGPYADYCLTNANQCVTLTDNIPLEEGAFFFANPLAAVCMVERIKQLNSKAVIITAAASQIGRIIIRICHHDQITPICVVRNQEQVNLLQELGCKYIVNSSLPTYKQTMEDICSLTKPSTCLECISSSTTGEMLQYLGFKSTLIFYGSLSREHASNIDPVSFIGKVQTMESFLLKDFMENQPREIVQKVIDRTLKDYNTIFKTEIHKRYGLDQIHQAIEYYQQNQTKGKIAIQPKLTQGYKL